MKNALMLTGVITLAAAMHADAGTLSASPAVVMLQGTPGQTTTQTLTLVNDTEQTFAFDMVAKDVAVRDGARVFVDAGQVAGSIAATAVFSQKSVSIGPGKRATIQVTLTIPANASVRAIAALFRGTTRIQTAGGSATASLGTLMTFALSNETYATASDLRVNPPTMSSNLLVLQQLTNRGSEPLVAKAILAILNPAGALVAKQALPARRVLPGENLDLNAEYGGELASGHYRALVTYDLQNNKTLTSSVEFDVR